MAICHKVLFHSTKDQVGSTQAVANGKFLQEGGVVCSNFQQRPIDVQFITGHYINSIDGELSNKSNDWGTATDERKHNFRGDNLCCPEEVKLSLSIGGPSRGKNIAKEPWNHKVICSQDITDLEESTETTSNEMDKPVSVDLEESTGTTKGVNLLTSYETAQFDLNKVQLDDSSFYPNDTLVANPSLVFDGIVGKFDGGACSTPASLREPKSNNYDEDISANTAAVETAIESKACSIDLESLSGPSLDLSDGPFNDDRNFESSQLAKMPCQDDPSGSSGDSEMQRLSVGQKQGEQPVEADYMVQKAALSLLCISLEESSTSNQDCLTKSGSNQIENEERENKPQYSSDSYESLVLKLKESSIDDDCVSSKPFELDEMDKKECGIKLRRGRRLKDFQRDILPSLSTLSRHEIWEDINIIEGVIRSREYKKLRAQTASEEKWFTPVRSRRSRLNYVGRKCYS